MNRGRSRTVVALALQFAALAALSLALLGKAWLDPRVRPRWLALVDRSHSVPRKVSDKAVADVALAVSTAGAGELQLIEFAGRPSAPSTRVADSTAGLDLSTTNIESALHAALVAQAQAAFSGVVVISDGLENSGDAASALRAVRGAGLPLQWIAVGSPPPPARIAEVLAPVRAVVGQRIRIDVQLVGESAYALDRPLRIKAIARRTDGETQASSAQASGLGRSTIEFDASRPGAVVVDLVLEDPATGQTIDAAPDAAVIDVVPRAAILYARGSTGPVARSLLQGGWRLKVVPAARLDTEADGLDGYGAVVLDDVAISDAGPRFWAALVAAVKNRGVGLMVLGGERSFARGGYRGSALESILPLSSQPTALDQPISVMFAVDKSGSMGKGIGGVDHFQLAQRAVLETANSLSDRDSLGLVVFDAAPRLLIPLVPAAVGTLALRRSWQTSPNGGTQLAPALDAAIAELERKVGARRMLVVVTDGLIDNAPLAEIRARLDRSRIETIALAVGADAEVGALERLIGEQAGLVLRVNEAADLPQVMRSGFERRRARVERGAIAVAQIQALPFPPGMLKDWPAIAAHAVTRPQPQALVALRSQQGEPLIAFQKSGRGRVVALTCGLGHWTPEWQRWRAWPALVGGLADWVGGAGQDGSMPLVVSDLAGALQVEAYLPPGLSWSDPGGFSIEVNTPTTQGRRLAADQVAPGRLRATLPDAGPGFYTFLVSTPLGTQRQLHLRRHRAESEAWGINPALDDWRAAGLIGPWDPVLLARHRGPGAPPPVDRSLMVLGLGLFLSAILVDRTRLNAAGVVSALKRWRARL